MAKNSEKSGEAGKAAQDAADRMNEGARSFMEMFERLGKDLKLPALDVERILDHHRRNFEAMQKSAETASSGASAIMKRQQEMLQETLSEIGAMAHSYRTVSSPQDLMRQQAEFARKSFDMAVRNSTEMAELVSRSGTETIDVLRQRIREGMNDIGDRGSGAAR